MCSAFDAAFTCAAGHDAFRADQVPTKSTHSKCIGRREPIGGRDVQPDQPVLGCAVVIGALIGTTFGITRSTAHRTNIVMGAMSKKHGGLADRRWVSTTIRSAISAPSGGMRDGRSYLTNTQCLFRAGPTLLTLEVIPCPLLKTLSRAQLQFV